MYSRKEFATVVLIIFVVLSLASVICRNALINGKARQDPRAALDRGDFTSAKATLEEKLKSHPKDPELHLLAAQTARRALTPVLPSDEPGSSESAAANPIGSRARAEEHLAAFHKHGGAPELERFERYLLRAQFGELDGIEGELMELVRKDIPESP